jgi:hypothetical protein
VPPQLYWAAWSLVPAPVPALRYWAGSKKPLVAAPIGLHPARWSTRGEEATA